MEYLFSIWLWFAGVVGLETPPPLVQSPKITFEHASIIDNLVCPFESRADIDKEIPRLQKLWDEKGPKLLQKASELLNSGFGYQEDVTGLFLCSKIPSWAKPRIISVWQYMPSTPANLRWQDLEFVDVVFHEHLHMLINRQLDWKLKSKLLHKYKDEEFFTKIHIHLYGVQKKTYLELGMRSEWEQVVKRNKTFPASYQRAIQIVELEGTKDIIAEVKSNPLSSP